MQKLKIKIKNGFSYLIFRKETNGKSKEKENNKNLKF